VAVKCFLDTSVLLGGLIDFGPQSAAAQRVMTSIADGAVRDAATRIYDAHIAETARAAAARVIVTDNRRHFLTALKHGLKVQTPQEFMTDRERR